MLRSIVVNLVDGNSRVDDMGFDGLCERWSAVYSNEHEVIVDGMTHASEQQAG
jgi:hypothetical protein